MNSRRYSFELEEESVLFECKGRFQVNYPRYVEFILNNNRVPHKVEKIYRKLSLIQAVRRISRFFSQRTDQNDSYCISPRPSKNSETNRPITVDLSNDSSNTAEEESDVIIIDDHHKEPACSITVLESGVFPRYDANASLPMNVPKPFDNHNKQINSRVTNDWCALNDRQVPITPQFNHLSIPVISPTLNYLLQAERYRTQRYQPYAVPQPFYILQNRINLRNERQFQSYLDEFKRLTHDVNHLYRKINRMINSHSFIREP